MKGIAPQQVRTSGAKANIWSSLVLYQESDSKDLQNDRINFYSINWRM